MIKKLIKYGKIIIAGVLIMTITLPSYATVSAADGSAFVTKAEYDAALADFNARLTTFESGINSKIDSQVSSYLDRNGIWNGSVQTCNYYDTSTRLGITCTSKTYTTAGTVWGTYIIIPKISKSGLINLVVDSTGFSVRERSNGTDGPLLGVYCVLEEFFVVRPDSSEEIKYTRNISDYAVQGYQSTGSAHTETQDCFAGTVSGKRSYQFFVNKDEVLKVRYIGMSMLFSNGTYTRFTKTAGQTTMYNTYNASVY